MSRLVGAFGYAEPGLALSSNSAASDWSVLRVVQEDVFVVEPPTASSGYVEGLPDSVLLKHVPSGRAFALTLDDRPEMAAHAEVIFAMRAREEPTEPTTLAIEKAFNPFLRAADAADFAARRAVKDQFRG